MDRNRALWQELADLAELLAIQRGTLAQRLPCDVSGCRDTSAQERIAEELGRLLRARAPDQSRPAHTAFEAARRAADVLRFEIPESHRALGGTAVTGAKRTAIRALKPALVEMLRPQHGFNVEAIEVMKLLWSRRTAQIREDSSGLVRKRLGARAANTAWNIRTHREGAAGQLVAAAKQLAVNALAPAVEAAFDRQREWNEAIVEALSLAGSLTPPGEREATELVARLAALTARVAESGGALVERAGAPLWNEALRAQRVFNTELMLAIAELLGTRAPPSGPPQLDYARWLRERPPRTAPVVNGRVAVVPVGFDAKGTEFAQSLAAQTHRDWALCVEGEGAFGEAEFVLFAGPGVTLSPECLASLVAEARARSAVLVYADEDRLTGGERHGPFFKPDWSPELALSVDYVGPVFLVARKALARPLELRGAPRAVMHRMVLELSQAGTVAHVSEVLFHLTDEGGDGHAPTEPLREAVEAHLRSKRPDSRVTIERNALRPHFRLPAEVPLVSIIVPFRDRPELLERLCATLLEKTRYPRFELLLVDNQSALPETRELLGRLTDPRIRHLSFDEAFNYSRINNFAVREAAGQVLVFLNNDIEVIDGGWLEELVSNALRPEIGAVGAKLTFPDGSLQHAGAVVGLSGFAGHPFWRFTDEEHDTAWGRADWPRNLLAVTAACMAVRADLFREAGQFDERFAVVGGDIELCLRLHARGVRNLFTPFAHLVHHESASRRADAVPRDDLWASFVAYRPFLQSGDPFYNRNLSLRRPDLSLREPEEDAQELAVRALLGTLGTTEQQPARAHATMQRHVADHLPSFVARRSARATRAETVRSVRWLTNARGGSLEAAVRLAIACEEYGGVAADVVVVGTAVNDVPGREAQPFVRFVRTAEELAALPPVDAEVSTDWTTAYALSAHARAPSRAFFVRSLEELNFPGGTLFGVAQNAYRLGLLGIFHGEGLLDRARGAYGMDGCAIELPVSPVFGSTPRAPRERVRRLFVQADAATGRDAFELAVATALRTADAHPEIEFVTAGAVWDTAAFPGKARIAHHGPLGAEGLSRLYASCDAALALGFGGAPTDAQRELMASGLPVVANDDVALHWLMAHDQTAVLADPTVTCLSDALSGLIREPARAARVGAAAASRMAAIGWEPQVRRVLSQLAQAPGTGRSAASQS